MRAFGASDSGEVVGVEGVLTPGMTLVGGGGGDGRKSSSFRHFLKASFPLADASWVEKEIKIGER